MDNKQDYFVKVQKPEEHIHEKKSRSIHLCLLLSGKN